MTVRFVDNAATFVTGLTEADAYNTLGAAITAAAAGDVIRVKNTHTETAGAGIAYTFPSTAGLQILSVAFDGAGTGALTAGAAINVGAANAAITLGLGFVYGYGISFVGGTNNSANCAVFVGTANGSQNHHWESCTFSVPSVHTSAIVVFGPYGNAASDDTSFKIVNCTVSLGANANKTIALNSGNNEIENLAVAGTAPTSLFSTQNGAVLNCTVRASDLSSLAWTNLVNVGGDVHGKLRFVQCKLRSGFTVTTATFPGPGQVPVELIDCNSADVNYYYTKVSWEGTVLADASVYYNASDGTTSISWLMTGNANSSFTWPLTSPPISSWNATLGAMTTTVEVTNDGTTYTDAQLWQETLAKVTSGVPLGTWNRADRAADITTAGTNQASSSVSWTGTGGFGAEVKQKLVSGSFTPAEIGPITTRVFLAANDSVYVSPRVAIA